MADFSSYDEALLSLFYAEKYTRLFTNAIIKGEKVKPKEREREEDYRESWCRSAKAIYR